MLKIKIKYLISGGLLLLAIASFVFLALRKEPEIPKDPEPSAFFGVSDFVLDENGFMTYTAGDYTTGIDVSEYQGEIDWQRVKSAGITFAYIRVGYRGTTEGKLYADTQAQSYYTGARAAGLQVGAYFFSQAITSAEAEEEAEFALEQISGWTLDLPVAYDWEWGGKDSRTTEMDKTVLTQCTQAFCQAIKAAGYEPLVYFNESQGIEQMELNKLTQYPFWLAQYDGIMDFPYPISYWQYSEAGKVEGISGNVDLNICILD